MRKPDDDARKCQASRLLRGKHKDDTNLVTLANKVVDGVDAYKKLKENTLKAKKKKPMIKRELDPKEGVKISSKLYDHPEYGDRQTLKVVATKGNKKIGHADIIHTKRHKNINSQWIHVDKEHRRKGIATAMYQHAEKVTGKKIHPSKDKTNEGYKFWQGTRQYGPKGHGPFGGHVKRIRKRELDPKEGISFSHRKSGQYAHPGVIEVRAHKGNDVIGHAHIRTDESHLESFDTTVSTPHRRKGVATGIYQYAEKLTGKKMKPGAGQTTAGRKLWEGKRGFGKSEHYFHSPEGEKEHAEIGNQIQSMYQKWKVHNDYSHEPYKKIWMQLVN